MSLQFYIGASGAGKSTTVYRDILERAKQEAHTRFFVVAPDQFTMQTQRVLCGLSESGGIMNVEVVSFGRLSHRVFEELGIENLPRLDDTGKNLILRKVAAEHEEELTVVASNLRRMGYIAQVKSMISEFAQYGIAPEDITGFCDITGTRGNLTAKLKDLQVLYRGYLQYIRGSYITTEESMDILVRNVSRSEILRDSVLVFDGFTGFTPIQELLLGELMLCARQVIVTLLGDNREELSGEVKEQQLFYLTARAYHRLEHIAKERSVERDRDIVLSAKPVRRYEKNPQLAHLEQNIFRYHGSRPVAAGEEKALSLICAGDPKAETEWICLTILRLCREQGLCYRDFAVITGDLPTYGYLLAESFAEHGIPLFLDRNVSLLFHPFMMFLQAVIEVCVRDFSYDAVMGLLRSGYLDIGDEEADLFERYLLKYGIRGKRKYNRAFVKKSEELEAVNSVRERLMDGISPILQSKRSAGAYTRAIYDICVRCCLEEKLRRQARGFEAEGRLAKAKEYEQVYKAVMGLLDQIYALLDEPMELEEYGEILKAGFAELKVGTLPQSVDQVVAGDMERTRLKPVKVLFVAGVNDGIIPGGGGSGGMLSDVEREFLLMSGIELAPTPRQKGFEERLYLYMNMTQPTERLYLSFAEVNTAGESLRPSYLIRTVERLFTDVQVQVVGGESREMVESRESGLKMCAGLLREYAAGTLREEEERRRLFFSLAKIFGAEAEWKKLTDAAFYVSGEQTLPAGLAKALYGEILQTSVSRLEQFAACAYAHFLRYGLGLSEEESYTFESVDLGNLYHEVLYRFGRYMTEGEYTWFTCPKEEADLFIEKSVDEFAASYGSTVIYDTARSEALKERAKKILKATVESLSYQIRQGLFEPVCHELPFTVSQELRLPSAVEIYGRIDRMDIVRKDGKVYVKVLDYKSGRHEFDPARLLYGLDLQLAVYMNVALAREAERYPGEEAQPAALFYYQIEDPVVESQSGESEEARELKRREQLKAQGLICEEDVVLKLLDASGKAESDVIPVKRKKDGSLAASSKTASARQMNLIGRYAVYEVERLAGEIQRGEIGVFPAKEGKRSACDYCAYRHVCGFDKKLPGFAERNTALPKEEAYRRMEEALAQEERR